MVVAPPRRPAPTPVPWHCCLCNSKLPRQHGCTLRFLLSCRSFAKAALGRGARQCPSVWLPKKSNCGQLTKASSEASAGVESAPERMADAKRTRRSNVRVHLRSARPGGRDSCPTHAVDAPQRQQRVLDAAHIEAA